MEQGPIKSSLERKLAAAFSPQLLQVENESHMHSVPRGSETHFKAVIVSSQFTGLSLLKRHRLVNEAVSEEITRIRALSLHTLTPEEWRSRTQQSEDVVPSSPTCRGGSLPKA